MTQPMDDSVLEVFDSYPAEYRDPLLVLRELIFEIAEATPGVGPILETLKWGQPSYIAAQTKSGTTVRLHREGADSIAIFVPCQTTLIGDFRGLFPGLQYSTNRAIVLDPRDELPLAELSLCIEMALTCRLKRVLG